MKNQRLYNYLVNTFGLSKQVILEYAEQRIEDILTKHIKAKLDSKHMESMILNKVTQILHGSPDSSAQSDSRLLATSSTQPCTFNPFFKVRLKKSSK